VTIAVDASQEVPTFPVRRECPFQPPAVYEEWREETPLKRVRLRDGSEAWALTRYADIKEMLASDSTSADTTNPHFPQLMKGIFGPSGGKSLRSTDEPGLRAAVDQTIDRMMALGSSADLHAELSVKVPCQMICQLLGAEAGAEEIFQPIAGRLMDMSITAEEFLAARDELEAFARQLVVAQEESPGEGLIGRLIVDRVRPGEMTLTQLIAFMMTLMVGGHETTATTISLGVLGLLREPAKLQALRDDPSLLKGAIDEMIRIQTISDFVPVRQATAEMSIGGQVIQPGEGLIPLCASGNRDPSVYDDAAEFSLDRGGRNAHLGFGAGIHACLGQNLARLELGIVFSRLIERLPSLSLAVPEDELTFKWDGFVFGIESLPVTW
jgi:cytochrome P450